MAFAQNDANAWITKGAEAARYNRLPEAAQDFEKALAIDPKSVQARLSLAVVYFMQYVPGVQSAENSDLEKRAEDSFHHVLQLEPKNKLCMGWLANFYYFQAFAAQEMSDGKLHQLDLSQLWYRKILEIAPEDKVATNAIGIIDVEKANVLLRRARSELGLRLGKPGPLPDQQLRRDLQAQTGPLLDDAIQHISRALEIDPEYEIAMLSMSGVYQIRANLADTADEYQQLLTQANEWNGKAMNLMHARAAEAARAAQASGQPPCPPGTICFDPIPGAKPGPFPGEPPGPLPLSQPPPPPPPPPLKQ